MKNYVWHEACNNSSTIVGGSLTIAVRQRYEHRDPQSPRVELIRQICAPAQSVSDGAWHLVHPDGRAGQCIEEDGWRVTHFMTIDMPRGPDAPPIDDDDIDDNTEL